MGVSFTYIGQRIKERRISQGLTQAQLAEQIARSVPYISLIEKATKKVSLTTLVLIADALGVTVDALINGSLAEGAGARRCDIAKILDDCSDCERRVIFDVVPAIVKSLRDNGHLHSHCEEAKRHFTGY